MELAKYAGIKIKELRKKKNITQTELAKKLNIGKSAISNYESGYRMPKQDLLFELSNIFEEPIDIFFPRNSLDCPQKKLIPLDKKLGAKITEIAEQKEIPDKTIAQLVKISLDDLQKYKEGRKPFTVSIVFDFALALGVTFDDVFPIDVEYHKIPAITKVDNDHNCIETIDGATYHLTDDEMRRVNDLLLFKNRKT